MAEQPNFTYMRRVFSRLIVWIDLSGQRLMTIRPEGREEFIPLTSDMRAKFTPEHGDYVLEDEDGWRWLERKADFESRAAPLILRTIDEKIEKGLGEKLAELKPASKANAA